MNLNDDIFNKLTDEVFTEASSNKEEIKKQDSSVVSNKDTNTEKKKMDKKLKLKIAAGITTSSAIITAISLFRKKYKEQLTKEVKQGTKTKSEAEEIDDIYKKSLDELKNMASELGKKLKVYQSKDELNDKEADDARQLISKILSIKSAFNANVLNRPLDKNSIQNAINGFASVSLKNNKWKINCNVNESAIKSLYEACQNGEITIEEREEKINTLKINSFFESIIEESGDDCLTVVEYFDTIKSSLYVKEAAGEISMEQREELIQKAREIYLG